MTREEAAEAAVGREHALFNGTDDGWVAAWELDARTTWIPIFEGTDTAVNTRFAQTERMIWEALMLGFWRSDV